MFTGLIETKGKIAGITEKDNGRILLIEPDKPLEDLQIGDSLSVDGVCLTVEKIEAAWVRIFAVSETLHRSTLRSVRVSDRVNLERALRVGDRVGGHWVTGHVDTTGEIASEHKVGASMERWIRVERQYLAQIAEKGSVAVDGVSLTVAKQEDWGFCVVLIPHTLGATTAAEKGPGCKVNIETDILAKYAQRLLAKKQSSLSLDELAQEGY